GYAKQDAKYDDLENLTFIYGFSYILRKGMHDHLLPGLLCYLGKFFVKSFGRHQPQTWLQPIGKKQPNDKGKGSDDFKVHQRLPTHAADLLKVRVPSYTRD